MSKSFKYRIGQRVVTKSGLQGKVIGSALYVWGAEYRVKVPGSARTMYRKEADLRLPSQAKKGRK